MSLLQKSQTDDASHGDRVDTASRISEAPAFECYCGLGQACPLFRMFTPEQRADCSRDKRRTGQTYYKNGMT